MTNLSRNHPCSGAAMLFFVLQAVLLATTAAAQPASAAQSLPPSGQARSGDAYVQEVRTRDEIRWRFGTALVEKQVQFKDGHLVLLSFADRTTRHEYVQGMSDLLSFTWNGHVMTGGSTSWVLDGVTTQRLNQGELNLQLHVHTDGVSVVKNYLLYPQESIMQEWLQITNRSEQSATLTDPLSFVIHMMQHEAASVDLTTMTGAMPGDGDYNKIHTNWDLHTVPLPEDSATFVGFATENWAPIQIYRNRTSQDGVLVGWDFTGNWQAVVGKLDGTPVSVRMGVGNYQRSLSRSERVELPKAFTGTFRGDLDEMGHQLLDYQYRYKWGYTRDAYFPSTAMVGFWTSGSSYTDVANEELMVTQGKLDPVSTYRKVFHLTDMLRVVGGDVYWRDFGWWKNEVEWSGPNWAETGRYLAQYDMHQTIYVPIGSGRDESQPAQIDQQLHLLEAKQREWGNFDWRVDGFSTEQKANGAKQIDQDQGYRRLVTTLLDRRPGVSYHGCAGGGQDLGYDRLELGTFWQLTDGFTIEARRTYNASYLFPPEKLETTPESNMVMAYDKATWRGILTSRFPIMGETEDPAKLEGVRELFDFYHYLTKMGVVGRWGWVYHPMVTGDSADQYLERLSGNHRRGVIVPAHAQKSPITIYPKGLLPTAQYQVSYQESPETATRSGAEWMAQGISFTSVPDGELIYLNLPLHPGSAADHTPPTPPSRVTQQVATHMDYSGVELRWQPGHDDNWVSYYQLSRNGQPLAKVAKGTYYFDHALGADLAAQYAVATVDGSGNVSAPVLATGVSGPAAIVIDDTNPALKYTGAGWEHQSEQWSVANGTQARTKSKGDAVEYTFVGSEITWYGRMGRDKGIAAVYLDGQLDRLVNTYDADEIPNIALYSRTFPALEHHTLKIAATGVQTGVEMGAEKDPSQSWIVIDGIQVDSTRPRVVEPQLHEGVTYQGTGWQQDPTPGSSGRFSNMAGDKSEYAFTGRDITLVGRRCSNCGMADVYVDGRLETSVDTYERPVRADSLTADEQKNVPVFTRRWPTSGRHTVRIVIRTDGNVWATGHVVYLDALQITP